MQIHPYLLTLFAVSTLSVTLDVDVKFFDLVFYWRRGDFPCGSFVRTVSVTQDATSSNARLQAFFFAAFPPMGRLRTGGAARETNLLRCPSRQRGARPAF